MVCSTFPFLLTLLSLTRPPLRSISLKHSDPWIERTYYKGKPQRQREKHNERRARDEPRRKGRRGANRLPPITLGLHAARREGVKDGKGLASAGEEEEGATVREQGERKEGRFGRTHQRQARIQRCWHRRREREGGIPTPWCTWIQYRSSFGLRRARTRRKTASQSHASLPPRRWED